MGALVAGFGILISVAIEVGMLLATGVLVVGILTNPLSYTHLPAPQHVLDFRFALLS